MTGSANTLIGRLKNDARRASERGDDETVKRYLAILATLMPDAACVAFRTELQRGCAGRREP
jgi:hypothetical protein